MHKDASYGPNGVSMAMVPLLQYNNYYNSVTITIMISNYLPLEC